jgi:hypothetical protein
MNQIAVHQHGIRNPTPCIFTTRLRGEWSYLNQRIRRITGRLGHHNEIVSRHQGVDQDRDGECENAGCDNVFQGVVLPLMRGSSVAMQ